ncbi:MAG TPA: hypothetical protein VG847_04595 [Chitinophagaceae bacterium]|nr:hypothetical protein [Chitinophagaceae bacterium]
MERVRTLIEKLQRQFDEKAPVSALLLTVQMLQAELQSTAESHHEIFQHHVAIIMPRTFVSFDKTIATGKQEPDVSEEKIVEVLQVDEKEIEEELEQIRRNAETVNSIGMHARPPLMFDPVEDIPTLAHQTPAGKSDPVSNEYSFGPGELNDKLKEVKTELSDKLGEAPIKDLRKAIGVNDRFVFINELFRGDEAMYERCIKTIQNFTIFAEAEYWIKRELKVKIGWHDNHPVVKQFDQLVKRRFA